MSLTFCNCWFSLINVVQLKWEPLMGMNVKSLPNVADAITTRDPDHVQVPRSRLPLEISVTKSLCHTSNKEKR